jgi:hypothetical protein
VERAFSFPWSRWTAIPTGKRHAVPWKNNLPCTTELSSRPERSGVERSAVLFSFSAEPLQSIEAARARAVDAHGCFEGLFGTLTVAAVGEDLTIVVERCSG